MTVPSDDADTVHPDPAVAAHRAGDRPPQVRPDPIAARRGIRQRTSGVPYRAYGARAAPAPLPGLCPAASPAFEPPPPADAGHDVDVPRQASAPARPLGLTSAEAEALRQQLGAVPGTGTIGLSDPAGPQDGAPPGDGGGHDTPPRPADTPAGVVGPGDPGLSGMPGLDAYMPGLQPEQPEPPPGAAGVYAAFTGADPADAFTPGTPENQAGPDPARIRRLKLVLVACGAAVTVGMGIAIALLMEEGTPPLRLGAAPARSAAHPAPAPAPGYESSGLSGGASGHAGAGAGGDQVADTACPLPGGPAACPTMVAIPAGRYRMGAARNDPEAQDEELGGTEQPIAAFELSAHEITAGQWQLCVNEGACPPPAQPAESSVMPVTGISWDAAVAYTAWLSRKTGRQYRLPTEVEWEYAARAGAKTVFPWGDRLGQRNAQCGQCGTLEAFPRFAPVGSYPPRNGLYDMVGNAYEWVADCWTPNHRQPLPPPQAACRDKVQKGGAFDTLEADVRPVARTHGDRTEPDARVGFRVARQLPPVPSTQRGRQ